MDEIVKYGKDLFAAYYDKRMSFGELEDELMKKAPVLSFNDFAVLGCYCETDLEVTLMLHTVKNIKWSKEILAETNDGISPKMAFMMLWNEIDKTGTALDYYFHCHKFIPMAVQVWKESWGTQWQLIVAAGEETVKDLPFQKPIFDRYIK